METHNPKITCYMVPSGKGVKEHPGGMLYLRTDVDSLLAELAAERDHERARRVAVEEAGDLYLRVANEMAERAEKAEESDAESIAMYRRARDRAEKAEAERNAFRLWADSQRKDILALRQRAEEAEAELAEYKERCFEADGIISDLRAERDRLREAGDVAMDSVEAGFVNGAVTLWDNTRAALRREETGT